VPAWCQRDFDDSAWAPIRLPHTWNALDGQDGVLPGNTTGDYRRGDGFYRTTFATDPAWQGRRLFVQFDAVNRFAEVWLNGHLLGNHAGGFGRFRFDITEVLAPSGVNLLAVKANNEPGGIIPMGGDFTQFGGIYRAVSVVIVDPVHIALLDYASSGVYLSTANVSSASADVAVRTLLENHSQKAAELELCVTLLDREGRTAAQSKIPCKVAPGATATARLSLRLEQPRLWQGRANPHLYKARIELRETDRLLDTLDQELGVRSYAVDPQRGFLLNGQPYPLRGVCRHQDRLDKGYAISLADEAEDLRLIEEIGANTIRLSHYQQSESFHRLCDESGMVLWSEVAYVARPVLDTPEFTANAIEQLRELIRQNYNHPSIFFWGLGNETDHKQPALADRVLASLEAVAPLEDSTRPTTYASHHPDEDPRNFRTDLIAFNKYFGWYGGPCSNLATWLDTFHAAHPQRPLGISEYGAGASISMHEVNPPHTRNPVTAWHPEEWQNGFHEESWLIIKDRPYLWATYVWNMFDFAADHRAEGDTLGRNDKGLVTFDRRIRKDAFYWYKANWNPEPMVYITSRRHDLRLEPQAEVKVYSNCDEVELWLNEVSLGRRSSADRRFVWPALTLAPGPNRIRVLGTIGGRSVTDACSWTFTPGTPYRPTENSGASSSITP